MKTKTHLAAGNHPVRKVAITGHAVAGTRVTVAHGLKDHLGRGVVPEYVGFEATAADADGAITVQKFAEVSRDATNVVFRCDTANGAGFMYVG